MKRRFIRVLALAALLSLTYCVAAESSTGTTAGSNQIEPAIQKVYPAAVRIYVVVEEPGGGRMERERAAGSGAIISSDGYIVTNHHVAGNAIRITCTMADGEEVEATKIGTDPLADIAVLKLNGSASIPMPRCPVAVWGDSNQLKVGDVVLAMGCPMAVSQSVTQGIVSNTQLILPRSMDGAFRLDGENVGQIVRWIGHDAVIFGGNSGGPLVNLRGEIVGINELGLGSLGGAIPSNLAKDVAGELIRHGHVTRSWIGIEFQPRLKSGKFDGGALVAGVVEGSPAAKAGIRSGDIITRFRGQAVNVELPEHLPLLNQLVFATPVGETVEIDYLRDGKQQAAKLTTEAPCNGHGRPAGSQGMGHRRPQHYPHDGPGTPSPKHPRRPGRIRFAAGVGRQPRNSRLQSEDIILKVGDQPMATWRRWSRYGRTGGRQNRAGAGAGRYDTRSRNNS